jgi:hypothetical protein
MGDYAALCPDSSMVAYGTDGRFVSNDLWTLRSVLVPFTTNGVAVGNVVRLVKPETTYKGGGTLMAVSSVAANALTLRRIGQPTGEGQAPGPVGGLTSITFECKTFGPQIEQVSYDLNQQYGIDPDTSFVGPTALADIRQLRQALRPHGADGVVHHRQPHVQGRLRPQDRAVQDGAGAGPGIPQDPLDLAGPGDAGHHPVRDAAEPGLIHAACRNRLAYRAARDRL